MVTEMSHTDDDHVVPGAFNSLHSESTWSQIISQVQDSASIKTTPDLWQDIEDILNLDVVRQPGDPQKGQLTRPANLSIHTPDFSVLINEEKLLDVDTPSKVPKSPGFHEVPATQEKRTTTIIPKARVADSRTSDKSLMETSMLINNSLASGCEYHRYDHSLPMTGLDISRTINPNSTDLQRAMEMDFDPEGFMPMGSSSGDVIDDMKDKVKYNCLLLDVPIDPNTWTVEHVQKWASFVMTQYDRVLESDLFLRLSIDGATLTTMTKEDFVTYFPNVGELLYNEMQLWCFASSCGHVMTTPLSNPVMPQAVQQEVTYTDLDSCKMFTYDMVNPSIASLPPMTSQTCPMQSHTPMLPPMCSMAPNQIYVKQEPCEIESEVHGERSPASSPVSAHTSRIASYSSSASSCSSYTSSSPSDLFEDRDLKRHIMTTSRGKHTIQLWQFLKELLLQPQCYEAYIRWLDRCKGIFKIEDSAQVAKLWGRRKNRPAMNYDKLSRSIRQYYKKGIIKKTGQSKRLVYQFCPQYNG